MSTKAFKEYLLDNNMQMIFLLFFIPLLLIFLGMELTQGNTAFYNLSPHPYLVISILFSAYYGLQFSLLFAPILAIQYLILLHLQTDYQAVETIITIKYLSLPLSIVILSALVGEFKTRSKVRILQLAQDNQQKEELTSNLIDQINLVNKESFEIKKQLVNKLDTTASIFSAVKNLNTLNKDDLFENYLEVIADQLKVQSSAIYLTNNTKTHLYLYKTNFDDLIVDIPTIIDFDNPPHDALIVHSLETQKQSTLDNIYSDKELLGDFKAAIVTPLKLNEDLYGLIIVYKIPFLQYTPRNFKILSLYTEWLSTSLTHALEFETITKDSILNQTLNIYTHHYLIDRIQEEIALSERYNFNFTLISLRIKNSNLFSEVQLAKIRKLLASILTNNTRKIDCVAEGENKDNFYILLNRPEKEDIGQFLQRFFKQISTFYKDESSTKSYFQVEMAYAQHTNEKDMQEIINKMEVYRA